MTTPCRRLSTGPLTNVNPVNDMSLPLLSLFRRIHWGLPFTRTKFSGHITGRRVLLDYVEITSATFDGCEIWYGGGDVSIKEVRFERCTWHVFGPAATTIEFMQVLNNIGGSDVIEKTFRRSPLSK